MWTKTATWDHSCKPLRPLLGNLWNWFHRFSTLNSLINAISMLHCISGEFSVTDCFQTSDELPRHSSWNFFSRRHFFVEITALWPGKGTPRTVLSSILNLTWMMILYYELETPSISWNWLQCQESLHHSSIQHSSTPFQSSTWNCASSGKTLQRELWEVLVIGLWVVRNLCHL